MGRGGKEVVLALAARVLAQDRQLAARFPHAQKSVVLGAFDGPRCAGFLRYQRHAARRGRIAGRYQMRSRGPVTSSENYALKIAAGYVLHPGHENDSYCFIRRL